MKLSTIATTRQTEAMLEQKRLALKFGLPQYIGFAGGQPSQSDGRVLPPAPSQDQPGQSRYEIVSIDARVTETNSSWWRYAWKLTVHNKSDMTMGFRAKIEFQDKDGFVIDDTNSDTFAVAAGADGTATGFALVRVPGASSVARTVAKVSAAR